MTRVVAQGTFDMLHPGHLHYLREASALGDQLHVIVARKNNVTHKPDPVIPERQRVKMVEALKPVNHVRLGHPTDIFTPIEDIEPDIIALGYDQHHDPETIESQLAERGINCTVCRVSGREEHENELLSTGRIIDKVLEERNDS